MLVKKISLIGVCLLCFFISYSQISGVVLGVDNNPISGVTVTLKNSKLSTKTNADGVFLFKTQPSSKIILIFSSIGFETLEIETDKVTGITASLKETSAGLNEVVVVGYGTQKRKDVTGSVVSLNKDRLEALPNNNYLQAIQGAVPGVSVSVGTNNAEGNGASILVRGRGSIGAKNSPLVIVDNIPYEGGMSELNPNDIESLEILKDASSCAIYGSRGANGVIIITTKQGKKGKMIIKYDGNFGFQSIANKPQLMNGAEFFKFKSERFTGIYDALGNPIYGDSYLKPLEIANHNNSKSTDWYDLTTQPGSRVQHTVSISGGADKTKFFFSGSYLNAKGIAKNDNFKRYTLRSNFEHKLTTWLTLNSNTQLSLQNRDGMAADFTGQYGGYYMNPLTNANDSNGNYSLYPWDPNATSNTVSVIANPLSSLLVKNEDNSYRILTSNNLRVDIPYIKGLSYKLNTGVELENTVRRTYYGRNTSTGFENGGKAINYNGVSRSFTIENILNYSTEVKQHSIGFTAVYSMENKDAEGDQYTGTKFPSDVLTNYQMSKAALLTQTASYTKQNLISQMIRLNYGYDSRYLFTFTARRDGYSGFAVDTKFGIFPSVALGWNIFREKFMTKFNDKWLSNLKLRLSYGLSGNQAVNPYQSLANFATRNYITADSSNTVRDGVILSKLENQKLGWESKKTFNIGLDIGILKNRITATIEYYKSNNFDLLLNRTISPIAGIASQQILQNLGKTENQGLEFSITSSNLKKKNFEWNTQANISFNTNKLVELYGNGKNDLVNKWFIGSPININFDYAFNGIYQTGEDASLQPGSKPGYVKIKDVNGDKQVTVDDKTLIGQTDPKYTWGIGNTIKYKRYSLYIFIQGVSGNTKENPLHQDGVFTEITRNTTLKNWWTPTNPNNEHWANDENANKWLGGVSIYENASFIRLKDITFSVDISSKASDKKNKFYITARNLATFTKYKGTDPEMSNQLGIPLQREITLGVSLTL
jgi:TonB-linked SusC/RagA family outer membrane protein